MKEAYVQHVILEYLLDGNFDAQFDGEWVDQEDFADIVTRIPVEAFAAYGFKAIGKYAEITEKFVADLLNGGGLAKKGDQYAGFWYYLNLSAKNTIAQKALDNNPAGKLLRGLPEVAFTRALSEIAREDGLRPLFDEDEDVAALSEVVSAEPIPASDRVVTLQHNQQNEIEEPLNEVLKLVEAENSIDGEEGLRELVLGRLKAGRELVRAGIFSVRSLQLTLIVGLQMLVEKYRDVAIGAIADKLLDLLLKQVGIG